MFSSSSITTSWLLLLSSRYLLAQDSEKPTINSPLGIVQCVPVTLTIGGGTPPYSVSILPGGDPTAPPLQTFPTLQAPGGLTWAADLAPGTKITFQVRDSKGAINYSSQNTIAPGGDCNALSPFGVPIPAGSNSSSAPSPATQAANLTGTPTPGAPAGDGTVSPANPLNPANSTTAAAPATASTPGTAPVASTTPASPAAPAAAATPASTTVPALPPPSTSGPKTSNSSSTPAKPATGANGTSTNPVGMPKNSTSYKPPAAGANKTAQSGAKHGQSSRIAIPLASLSSQSLIVLSTLIGIGLISISI